MYRYLISLAFLLSPFLLRAQDTLYVGKSGELQVAQAVVSGTVRDEASGEVLFGANVLLVETNEVFSVDRQGTFRFSKAPGLYTLRVTFLGYQDLLQPLRVYGDGYLDLSMALQAEALEEVVVSTEDPRANITNTTMGVTRLSIKSIEALPLFAGETDILKSLVLLPGVSSVGEASSGFNVRGGSADQNLVLLGGVPIYNPSHLFGYFSAFNSEVVNSVTVYKGGIPAKFGGRASSVINLEYKKGDLQKWAGNLSLGTISSQASAGGPLIKDKVSILLGGRLSYSNWILQTIDDPEIRNSSANFFDGNVIAHYQINEDHSLSYSFYQSGDRFNLLEQNEFQWFNQLQSLEWNGAFSEKVYLKVYAGQSLYDFEISDFAEFDSFRFDSDITDRQAKAEISISFSPTNVISVGGSGKNIKINPGNINKLIDDSGIRPSTLESEQGNELAFFVQHEVEIGKKLGIIYGLRFNHFSNLGPKTVYQYDPFETRSEENITERLDYPDGETIATYQGLEPRFSLRYAINENTSVKLGFNRMIQNIGLISNTTAIAPTDIWKLADSHIEPTRTRQYSAGFFKNFSQDTYEVSLEGYYKSIDNIIEYKDGANLFLNPRIETELLSGIGEAFGAELYIRKNSGKLTGWLSYTYSRSLNRVIGFFPEETINRGEWYPANFDKPHDLTNVLEYQLNPQWKFSTVFTYSTGRPVSYPVAKFDYLGQNLAYYEARNDNRVPDYHRLDFSITFSPASEIKILAGDWILSVYNAYGRKNAFSVFFDDVPGSPPQAFRLATLGVPFPSLSYKVKL